MKQQILIYVLLFLCFNAFSQQNRLIICKMSFYGPKPTKAKPIIDYGNKAVFSMLKDTSFLSKTDSVVNINNEAEAIRYFIGLGWEIFGITTSHYGFNESSDFIFWQKKADD